MQWRCGALGRLKASAGWAAGAQTTLCMPTVACSTEGVLPHPQANACMAAATDAGTSENSV